MLVQRQERGSSHVLRANLVYPQVGPERARHVPYAGVHRCGDVLPRRSTYRVGILSLGAHDAGIRYHHARPETLAS